MAPDRTQQIGPYQVLARLGAGGMGEVYCARDSTLERDVALKILPRELADDPDRRARLLREARAAAALNHPNICTIYEVGEADGKHFIAMEVIEGEPLSARLAAQPLPTDEVVRIALQLADAVGHAHDRGVLHRDLKSANVMLAPDGRVKVLDFGLAKRVRDDSPSAPTAPASLVTEAHTVLGTLAYMSPEQLRAEPADARSDVWALGVVLYEMLAGSRPFGGSTAFEASAAILREDPPALPPHVPPSLKRVIGRCLEKEPARRYQRAGELRAALETLRAEPGAAPAPPSSARRRRLAASVSAATVVALAAGALWFTGVGRSPGGPVGRIRSIAVLPLDNLSGDPGEEYFVAGMHEALITDLARIGLQKVIAKPSADAFRGTVKPLRDIGRELGVQGLVTGSVVRASSRVRVTAQLVDAESGAVLWANRYERAAGDVLSLQNDVVGAIARELRATLTPEQSARLATARPVNAGAHDAYLKGRSSFAAFTSAPFDLKRLEATVAQLQQSITIDPTYAPPHAALSLAYLTLSQTSLLPPKETFPKARAAALQAVALDALLADGHAALGEVKTWYDWDWTGADREIRRALELNPDSIDALRAQEAFYTLVTGQPDEAARVSERILSLDPLTPFSRIQPAWVAFFSRRHEDSIRFAKSLLEVWPDNIMGPFFLALNHAVQRNAEQIGAQCSRIMSMLGGAYVMQLVGQCAWAYATVGRVDEARRLLATLERPPKGTWLDPVVMGQIYGALGDADAALAWFERGLAERSPNMIYMKAAAGFDSVRADPRFAAMLRGMNFPE